MTKVQQSFIEGFVKAAAEAFNPKGFTPKALPSNLLPPPDFSKIIPKVGAPVNSQPLPPSLKGSSLSQLIPKSPSNSSQFLQTKPISTEPSVTPNYPRAEKALAPMPVESSPLGVLPNSLHSQFYKSPEAAEYARRAAVEYRYGPLNRTLDLSSPTYEWPVKVHVSDQVPLKYSYTELNPKGDTVNIGAGGYPSFVAQEEELGGADVAGRDLDLDYNIPKRYADAARAGVDPEGHMLNSIPDVYAHELGHSLNKSKPGDPFADIRQLAKEEPDFKRMGFDTLNFLPPLYAATPLEAPTNLAPLQRDLTAQGNRVETPWEAEALLRKYLLPKNKIPEGINTKTQLIDFMRGRSEIQGLPISVQRWMNDIQNMIRVGGNNNVFTDRLINDAANAFPGLL